MLKTREAYEAAFEKERQNTYPVIDAFEARMGYAIDREWLEGVAKVLACPIKKNPPCWQHGRVLYALIRDYLRNRDEHVFLLDIGTAKGFSACVMLKALDDAGHDGTVVSVDSIDPNARVARNSIADLDGLKTVWELITPFCAPRNLTLKGDGSLCLLNAMPVHQRINIAFVDGKHDYDHVREESRQIGMRMRKGDTILFDDLQIRPVAKAVSVIAAEADFEKLSILTERTFGIVRW